MESLKIRDKKAVAVEEEVEVEVETKVEQNEEEINSNVGSQPQMTSQVEEELKAPVQTARSSKPTFGQSLMEKVKKFFEEVE